MPDIDNLFLPSGDSARSFPNSSSRVSTKGYLVDYETGDRFEFFQNPSSISDEKNNSIATITIPGTSNPIIQWSSGGKRSVSFSLGFYHMISDEEVRRKIEWLQSLQYPEYSSDGRLLKAPHRVLFIFGNTYSSETKWIVEKVKVDYSNLWSKELEPLSAKADLTLIEWNESLVSYETIRR